MSPPVFGSSLDNEHLTGGMMTSTTAHVTSGRATTMSTTQQQHKTHQRHQRSVMTVDKTMEDTGGYRVDVTVWFRHKNEVLYYVDSASRVHGPMDQRHTARLGAIQHTAVPLQGQLTTRWERRDDNMLGSNWQFKSEQNVNRSTIITTTDTGTTNRNKRRTLSADNSTLELDRLLSELSNVGRDYRKTMNTSRTCSNQDISNSSLRRPWNHQKYSTTLTRQHIDHRATTPITIKLEGRMDDDQFSHRERRLMDELLEARKEIATLHRSHSLADWEKLRSTPTVNYSRTLGHGHVRQSDSNIQSSLYERRMRGGKSNYSAHREQIEVKTVEQPTDVFEEIETITLQPIGKGVQDLESTVHQHSATMTQRTVRSTTPSGIQRVLTPSFEQTSHQRRMHNSSASGVASGMPPPGPFMRQGSNYEIHQESHNRYGGGHYTINGPTTYSSQQQIHQQSMHGHQQSAPISPGIHSLGGHSRSNSMVSSGEGGLLGQDINSVLKGVQETSKIWYQPFISREEVINILQDMPPGSFLVRDSNTFPDAFGLALRVAAGPRRSKGGLRKYLDGMMKKLTKDDAGHQKRSSKEDLTDSSNKKTESKAELVRHYLIEPVQPKGVRLKHFSNEPVFQTLAALIAQHTLQPIALPCRLLLPDMSSPSSHVQITTQHSTGMTQNSEVTSSMQQGQVTSTLGVPPSPGIITTGTILFLGCVEVESLSGPAALTKACGDISALPPSETKISECQLKLSNTEGITITDVARKNFFRRNFPIQLISFYGVDPRNRSYNVPDDIHKGIAKAKLFGFVTRKVGSTKDYNCFILCEYDINFTAHAAVKAMGKVLGPVR